MDETTKMKTILKLVLDLNPEPESCRQLAMALLSHSLGHQIMRQAVEMSEYGKEECFPGRDYYQTFKEALGKAKDLDS